ncbi:MAG TPA: biopolymer transporter ExbD [Bacteroidales bacterium]|nr:biopolymer transporter ExbD [Bacteroidales bacterium]
MAIKSRNKVNMNFSMSGMTDIVFLLLIFFMITSTLIVPGVNNVELPHSNNQTVATPDINVTISRQGQFFIDGNEIAASQLESSLKSQLKEKLAAKQESGIKTPTVRLNADENLNMNEVFDFLEIAKRNKYKVILGTRPL